MRKKEEGCPYYEAKRELFNNPQNWAGVHHHITEFLADFLYSLDPNEITNHLHYSVLIIDENPISVLFVNEKGDATQLAEVRNMIEKLNLDSDEAKACKEFLDFLIINFIANTDIDYNKLYKLFSAVDFRTLYEEYQIEIIDRVIDGQMSPEEIPREYLVWFDRIQKHASRAKIENMIVKREASGYTKKHYYFMCFEETVLHNLPFKVIGLDGTANVEIWESIIGEKSSLFYIPYDYKNIYQLNSGEYPLSSWVEPFNFELRSTGRRLCNLIDLISQRKKNKVLICSSSALKESIMKECKSNNLIYGYFYYLRSRNDFYQTADTVIIANQPNIPEFQLECFSNLSSWDGETWRQVFTDEEMVQGVGRIRFDIPEVLETHRMREKREIYIFPSKGAIENPFENWTNGGWDYTQMKFFAEYGLTPEEKINKDLMYVWDNLVPEEGGLSKTQLWKMYYNIIRKDGFTSKYARDIVDEIGKRIKKIKGETLVKGFKIHKGLVGTIKKQ